MSRVAGLNTAIGKRFVVGRRTMRAHAFDLHELALMDVVENDRKVSPTPSSSASRAGRKI
jgi:hypothetical protein